MVDGMTSARARGCGDLAPRSRAAIVVGTIDQLGLLGAALAHLRRRGVPSPSN
jgi:hypothetical protein